MPKLQMFVSPGSTRATVPDRKPATSGGAGSLIMTIRGKKQRVNVVGLRNSGVLQNFVPTEEQVKAWTFEANLKSKAVETWIAANSKNSQDTLKAKLAEFRSFLSANERRATQRRPSSVPEAVWSAYVTAMIRLKTVLGQGEAYAKQNLGGQFVVGTILLPGGSQAPGTTLSLNPADVQAAAEQAAAQTEVEEASILPSGFFGSILGSVREHTALWVLGGLAMTGAGVYLWKKAPKAMPPSEEFLREQEEI